MFKNLLVNFDKITYDPDLGQTFIEGWAFNPVTKEPVEIEADVPAHINSVMRLDINKVFNIPAPTPYGFFISIPGDYRKSKPTLTFTGGIVQEQAKLSRAQDYVILQKARKLREIFVRHGLLKEKNVIPAGSQEPKDVADDEFTGWINNLEKLTFSDKTPDKAKITYIIRAKSREGLEETIESIKETDSDGQILIATNTDLDYSENPVCRVLPASNENPDNALVKALNNAANYAVGDYLTIIDSKDRLAPEFLNEVSVAIKDHPEAEVFYADSDLIDQNGRRYGMDFKPDFDETYLRHTNFIKNPIILRKEFFDQIGRFKNGKLGLKDYDLITRATKAANEVVHIPHILYHWLKNQDHLFDIRRQDSVLGAQILNDVYGEVPLHSKASDLDFVYTADIIGKFPSVSIITGVCEGFSPKTAERTIKDTIDMVDYPNYHIIGINVEGFSKNELVTQITDKKALNLTELFNFGASQAKGDYLLFLRPGFRGVEMSWLKELVALALEEKVGIVGPKIFNNNFTYETAGITLFEEKRYDLNRGDFIKSTDYNNELLVPKEVFAVSEDALLIKRALFEKIGGFDTSLPLREQSIDLSVKARELGYKTVNARNTPGIFDEFKNRDGKEVIELYHKYPRIRLIDKTINENMRRDGTAYPYRLER